MKGSRFIYEWQVAEMMECSLSTIRSWRYQGLGPPFYKYPRAVRYREDEVLEFIKSKKRNPGGSQR